MQHLLTLRFLIPLLIGVFSLVVTLISYSTNREAALNSTLQAVEKGVTDNLTSVQSTIELLLSIDQQQGIKTVVAAYSGKLDNLLMLVVDENGQVIASTSHQHISSHWQELPLDLNRTKIDKVIATYSLDVTVTDDHSMIEGIISLCPKGGRHALRTSRCGFLLQHVDLDYHNRQAVASLTSQAIFSAVGIFLIAVLIGLISHLMFASRVKRISATLQNFSDGQRNQRSGLTGADEIAQIAQSVDKMLDHLEMDEQAILAEKNRLRTLFDTVSDPIVSIDENKRITGCNNTACKVFGYSLEQMLQLDLFHLVPDVFTDDENGSNKILGEMLDYEENELSAIRYDGSHFPAEFAISEMRVDGHTEQIAVIRDITHRKQVENELKQHRDNLQEMVALATTEINAIVQTAVNAVITIDQHGIVHIFNPAAETMFGWNASEVVGKNIAMLMAEIDASAHDGYLINYIKTRKPHVIGQGREVKALRKNGHSFPAHLSVGHRELSDGEHLFVAFITDITEQKQAEHALRKAKENAEQAARTKASFLANMSHEIRTPMNAVIGFSEVVLQDPLLSKSSRQHLLTILTSGKNLLNIINDILDFSKIEAGKISLELLCFHLPNVLNDSLRIMGFKAAEKDIQLHLKIAADVPTRVLGDSVRLRQVILNLVGNAIKFTSSGSVTISVERMPSNALLHFCVTDTGIGMTQSQVDQVFEAFTQADESTNRRFGGTGLGTTICRQIVELMKGEIWAESEHGKGSSFHFTVELPVADDPSAYCLFEDGTYVEAGYHSPRRFKVLLAEDIATNATLATLHLEQQGHQVEWVENGAKVLEALANDSYDLILMDVQMPEMDGLEATRIIRREDLCGGYQIPILALTASVMSEDQQQCLAAGMDGVQGKPINFDELMSVMEKLVPEERGTVNSVQIIPQVQQHAIDFSLLKKVTDCERGLAVWQDGQVYAQALQDFVEERTNSAEVIQQLLQQYPNDNEPARAVAHALKGLAGNLAIPQVESLSREIDALLKRGKRTQVHQYLLELDQALQELHQAMLQLDLPTDEEDELREMDVSVVGQELIGLLGALDELNPEVTEPHLEQLQHYIRGDKLSTLRHSIERFDFEEAKIQLRRLAATLDITLN